MSDARCIICDHVVPEAEIAGLSACPKCGSKAQPTAPELDMDVRLNLHELRILTMFADSWARNSLPEDAQVILDAVIDRLRKQCAEAFPGKLIHLTPRDGRIQVVEKMHEAGPKIGGGLIIGAGEMAGPEVAPAQIIIG